MREAVKNALKKTIGFGMKFGILPSKMAKFVNTTGTTPTPVDKSAGVPVVYKPSRAERRAWAHSLRKRCTRNTKFHAKRWGGQADHRANHMAAHDKATLWPALVHHLRHTAFNK